METFVNFAAWPLAYLRARRLTHSLQHRRSNHRAEHQSVVLAAAVGRSLRHTLYD